MGARVVFRIRQTDGMYLNLYSHWGEYDRFNDLSRALQAAKPRWSDESYAARIIVSQLVADQWGSETGYGLWASKDEDGGILGDCQDLLVDLSNNTVTDETGTHSFEQFINYHSLTAIGAEV